MSLAEVLQILTIATIIGGAFSYLVLNPLHASIVELKTILDRIDSRVAAHSVSLAELDQRARSAHHRIDDLARFLVSKYGLDIPSGIWEGGNVGHK